MDRNLLSEFREATRPGKEPTNEIQRTHDSQILQALRGRLGDGTVRWPTLRLGPAAQVRGRRLRLVVVEDNAEGLGPYLSANASEDTMVIRQSSEESPAELAVRAIRRIASIERSGQGVAKAVVLLAPRVDQQAMAARQLIARALLVHARIVPGGSSELVLAVGSRTDPALRHRLMALVEALVGEPEACSMAIRIRFDFPAPVETAA